jgi:hypothetical protein
MIQKPSDKLLAQAHALEYDDRERARLISEAARLRDFSRASSQWARRDLADEGLWRR